MEPIDLTSAVNEMAADTSPAPILNVGIFFDGTYNNAYDQSILATNVWRLFNHYKERSDAIFSSDGSCKIEDFARTYIPGIGSESGGFDRGFGGFSGYGEDGIFDKLEQGVTGLREAIDESGGLDYVTEVRIDIFGFSRGAATARVFASAIAAAGVAKIKTRFLGLYDTLGSFGMPGDRFQSYPTAPRTIQGKPGAHVSSSLVPMFNVGILDLNIHGSTAETVFQIAADDEYRAFFPLSSVLPGGQCTEVFCPGSHGDIGDAAQDHVVRDEYAEQERKARAALAARGRQCTCAPRSPTYP
ncbi:MAG: DUF2235 domain-containing protein [Rhodobacteraceae bacterium]|nr:DUF2235 domain-containing protein [Paracoccaceae bacterium]